MGDPRAGLRFHAPPAGPLSETAKPAPVYLARFATLLETLERWGVRDATGSRLEEFGAAGQALQCLERAWRAGASTERFVRHELEGLGEGEERRSRRSFAVPVRATGSSATERRASDGAQGDGFPPLWNWREHDGVEEVLRAQIVVQFCGEPADDPAWRVSADLTYRPSDPYAVEAVFKAPGHGDGVSWILARDLLLEGLRGRSGTGDVQVWSEEGEGTDPPANAGGGQRTYIRLTSEEGTAVLFTRTDHLAEFLELSRVAVAVGAEHNHLPGGLAEFEELLRELVVAPGIKDAPRARGNDPW